VKNLIKNDLSDLLKEKSFLPKFKRYNKACELIGKKRKEPLSKEEIEEIIPDKKNLDPKAFKLDEDKENELYLIEYEDLRNYSKICLYKKPFLIKKIFDDTGKIDIDFIVDPFTMAKKIIDLRNYNFEVFFFQNNILIKKDSKFNLCNITTSTFEFNNKTEISSEKKSIDIREMLLIMKSQIPTLDENDLKYENIYPDKKENSNLISPKDITKFYFYYFIIPKDLADIYKYIHTEEREKFEKSLEKFICQAGYNNIRFLGGNKGIGKTTSLIHFSFEKTKRIFYINLEAYQRGQKENKLKDLKLQLNKLFGPWKKNDEGKMKDEIEKYIIDNYLNKGPLKLVLEIMTKFIVFAQNNPCFYCFIIDQISFSSSYNNEDLNKIINIAYNCIYIKLIICSTINNNYSKENLIQLFSNEPNYDFFYLQELIKEKDIKEHILVNEKNEIINIMKELGNSAYYYYELKKRQDSIGTYKLYLKDNINKNLLEYYNNNLDIEKILELLDYALGEKVISSSSLKDIINKIPLKYLKIKKFKINHEKISKIKETNKDAFINYLYLLFYYSENKKNDIIFSNYFDILEINDSDLFIQNYLEKDENCRNIFGDYFNNYIKIHRYLKSEKIEELFVYKIEFSNNFFQEILMSIIYEHLLSEYKVVINLFNKSSIGNFFEIIVNYYFMQESSIFFDKKIEQIAYIPTLVPHNYSIKNYSSKRRKQNFKDFNIKENEHKYKLEFKNTYIIQTI